MCGEGKKLTLAAQLLARGQLFLPGEADSEEDAENNVTDALAAFGLHAEGALELDQPFALWPENQAAFNFWFAVQTQWRVGMAGATGLDYSGVQACMALRGIRKKDQSALFVGLQIMERATLDVWAE